MTILQSFNILAISSSILYNYFNGLSKIIFKLYFSKVFSILYLLNQSFFAQ